MLPENADKIVEEFKAGLYTPDRADSVLRALREKEQEGPKELKNLADKLMRDGGPSAELTKRLLIHAVVPEGNARVVDIKKLEPAQTKAAEAPAVAPAKK